MSESGTAVAHPHPAVQQLAALHHLRIYVDIGVVVVVLAITNLVAHFTSSWEGVLMVPAAAVGLLMLVRARGLGWAELGLGREHIRRKGRGAGTEEKSSACSSTSGEDDAPG